MRGGREKARRKLSMLLRLSTRKDRVVWVEYTEVEAEESQMLGVALNRERGCRGPQAITAKCYAVQGASEIHHSGERVFLFALCSAGAYEAPREYVHAVV